MIGLEGDFASLRRLRRQRQGAVADFFEFYSLGVGEAARAGAMLLVEEGSCEFGRVQALLVKGRRGEFQLNEQCANHVRRVFSSATHCPPNFGEALFVDFNAGRKS